MAATTGATGASAGRAEVRSGREWTGCKYMFEITSSSSSERQTAYRTRSLIGPRLLKQTSASSARACSDDSPQPQRRILSGHEELADSSHIYMYVKQAATPQAPPAWRTRYWIVPEAPGTA